MLSAFLSAPTFGQQEKGKWAGVKKNVSPVVAVDNPQLLNSAKADSPYDYLACPANSVLSGTLDETAGFTGHQSADLGRLDTSPEGTSPNPTRFYQSFSGCYQTISGLRWLGFFNMWDGVEYDWLYCHDRAGIDENGDITEPVVFNIAFYKMDNDGNPGEKIYDKDIAVTGKYTRVNADQFDDNSQIYSFEADLGETIKLESGFFSITAVKVGEGSTCGFCVFTADNIPGSGLTEILDPNGGDSYFFGAMSCNYCLLGDGSYSAQKALKFDRILTPSSIVSSKYEKVQVEVLNVGEQTIDNASLQLWVDGKLVATENVEADIESGESYKHLFAQRADCSATGNHTITIKNVTEGDEKLCPQSMDFVCSTLGIGEACESGSNPDYVSSYDMISSVKIGDIDNSSEESAYSDFTDKKTDIHAGETLELTVKTSNSGDIVGVWVDWNSNGGFSDSGEFIGYLTYKDNLAQPIEVSIPEGAEAAPGDKRMRIVMSAYEPAPCGTYDFGETEDYTLTVAYHENAAVANVDRSSIEWQEETPAPVQLEISNEGSSELTGTLSLRYDLPNSPNARPLASMSKKAPFGIKKAARKTAAMSEPAATETIQHVLRYDNGYGSPIALSNGNTATYAQYFPAAMVSALKGMSISSVDVYLSDLASVNKIVIYEGVRQDQPEKEITSQEFTAQREQWNNVKLSQPVTIGDKDLWIAIYMEGFNADEYQIGIDSGSATRGFGDLVNVGGSTWWSLADLGMDSNICIRGNVTGERTPAIDWLSMDKAAFTLAAGQSETVTVTANPDNLDNAFYEAVIEINSNDELKKTIKVPVYLAKDNGSGITSVQVGSSLVVYGNSDTRTVKAGKAMSRISITGLNGVVAGAWDALGEESMTLPLQQPAGIYLLCVEFADGTKEVVKIPVRK